MHRAPWPTPAETLAPIGEGHDADLAALDLATELVAEIRRVKSESQVPHKTPVAWLRLTAPAETLALFDGIRDDVCAAGLVTAVDTREGARAVVVELGSLEPVKEAGV